MADNKPTFINMTREGIKYGFHARYRVEENGMYSWYIPAFDIYFSSQTKEQGDKRAVAMTKSFFNHWINYESFRSFILQIHKLGFKASEHHELTIKQLISRQRIDAKFKSKDGFIPEEFKNSETVEQEGNLEMAM